MKCVGYIRVSTLDQSQNGVSLDAQRAAIVDYCRMHNLELMEVCRDEGISGGKSSNRPGLKTAMGMVCKHKAVLVVYSLSRFARSVIDATRLIDQIRNCGADFASITEQIDTSSAMGKFIFTIFAALGEMELGQIKERTKAALRHKMALGQRVSKKPPYGYGVDETGKMLVVDLYEQAVIGHMLHTGKQIGVYKVCNHLNRMGIMARSGKNWHPNSVIKIIQRERQKCSTT